MHEDTGKTHREETELVKEVRVITIVIQQRVSRSAELGKKTQAGKKSRKDVHDCRFYRCSIQ